ncbi:MAG: ABC transporter ATP-binding protein [Muribaculaceae bacterium]
MNFIEVKNVVKQYSGHRALDDVSLVVPRGCVYGLLGPNGAGKTSLIRILNRITHADSGEVLFCGKPQTDADVRNIGYLPEERGLYKKMKVAEQIIYLGRLKGMTRSDAITATDEWLRRFDLTEWRNKKIEALSKGMAQKVQFISTVIHRPELLIFDEPFSGFDPVNANQLKREILRLKDEGATILFSTHNMASVEEVCERITLINHSRVVLEGDVAEVRRRYSKHLYVIDLAGQAPLAPADGIYTVEACAAGKMGGIHAEIRLCDGVAIRDAIARINSQYDLVGFSEKLPTMNEVFIETVQRKEEAAL